MAEQKENRFSGMTPEEIRLEAKRQIVRSAFLALAALIVIGVACYAWFASNKSVSAEGITVSIARDGFELASSGEAGIYDKYLDATLPAGEFWDAAKTMTWTNGNQIIRWRVDQTSNLGNTGTRKGIRPNSKGSLTFYVIPNTDGPLTIDCNLNFQAILKDNVKNSDNAASIRITSEKLLRGHILFDQCIVAGGTVPQDENAEARAERLEKAKAGYFQLSFPNAKANQPERVTLDWFWPYILREAINHPNYGEKIENLVNEQDMADYFFYNNGEPVSVAETSFKYLSRYFNNADQFVGDNVTAIVLELTANLAK